MPDTLIDTTRVDKQQDRDKRKRDRDTSDIRSVIKTAEGRRFYWRVMEEGKAFEDPFTGETNGTMYNLGRQSISRNFLNYLMEASSEALSQMQQERASEAKREENIEQQELIKESALL